jgi:hypothetical protein
MENESWSVSVVETAESNTKTTIDIELDEDFLKWFKKEKAHGRWNKTAFESWFKTVLLKAWLTLEQGKYKTVYSRTFETGKQAPKVGDIVTFFRNGYRTRVVSEVSKRQVKLEPLWDGDSQARVNVTELHEILRPRKPVRLPREEDE